MASTYDLSNLSAYSKENGFQIITDTFMSGTIQKLQQNGYTPSIFTNLTGKVAAIPMVSTAPYLQAQNCTWGASGVTTFNQADITLFRAKVELSYCSADLQNYFLAYELKNSLNDEIVYEAALLDDIKNQVSDINEKLMWQGNTNGSTLNLTEIDGWITLLTGATTRIHSATYSATTTAVAGQTGITTLLENMMTDIPDAIAEGQLCAFMSPAAFRMLSFKLASTGLYQTPNLAPTDPKFMTLIYPNTNVLCVGVRGMSSLTKVVITDVQNLVLGTNVLSEAEGSSLTAWYSQDNDQMRVRMNYIIGCQILRPDYCVCNF